MPGFNNKGPHGNGPVTGRKLGRCKQATDKTNSNSSSEDSIFDSLRSERSFRLRLGMKKRFSFGRREH